MNNIMNSLNEIYNTKVELKKKLDVIDPDNNVNEIFSQYPSILKNVEYLSIFYTIMKNNINLSNFYNGRSTVPENVDFSNVKVPKNVKSLSRLLANCNNLKTVNMNGFDFNEVNDVSELYSKCTNLVSVDFNNTTFNNVTNMCRTYYNCTNLTGSPVCGPNVTDMHETYHICTNLTGAPVCGNNVTNMRATYYNCYNLTGAPVCGPNVTNMQGTYYECTNLTGSPVCGDNVTNMQGAYSNCHNLHGNSYFYSNNVSNMRNCFYGRNTSNRLNIYVHKNSTTMNTCIISNANSMVGARIQWRHSGNRYYNTTYNIYIYPVENVYTAKINNGD